MAAFFFGKKTPAKTAGDPSAGAAIIDPKDAPVYRKHQKIESEFQKEKAIVVLKYRFQKYGVYGAIAIVLLIAGFIGLSIWQNARAGVDTDRDGVSDRLDACPNFDDAIDRDQNGVADGCDLVPPPLDFNNIQFDPPMILQRGDGSSGTVDVVSFVTNKELEWHLTKAIVRITRRDAGNMVLGTHDVPFFIATEQVRPVIALALPGTSLSSVTVEVLSGDWKRRGVSPELKLPVANIINSVSGNRSVTEAILDNKSTVPIREIFLVATARDAAGNLVAVNQTSITDVQPSTARLIYYSWTSLFGEGTQIRITPLVDLARPDNFSQAPTGGSLDQLGP